MKLRLTKKQLVQIISEARGALVRPGDPDYEYFSLGEPPEDEARGRELEDTINRLAGRTDLTDAEQAELFAAEDEYAELMGW